MSDLGPFWLSLRVASLATLLDRRRGNADCARAGTRPVSGQGTGRRYLGAAPGAPPHGAGLLLAPASRSARARGALARTDSGRHVCVPLVGCRRGIGGGGVSTVPAAGAGSLRGDRPGPRRRGTAARAWRMVGVRRRHAPLGLARAGRRHGAGFCPRAGRLWRDFDGCRQHPRPHANGRAGDLRRRAGRRRIARRLAHPLDLGDIDPGASWLSSAPCRTRGSRGERADRREPGRTACSTRSIPRSCSISRSGSATRSGSYSERREPARRPCCG